MDMFTPGAGVIGKDGGVVRLWGDGARPIEVTSVADTARMAARVAADPTVPAGKFAFAGAQGRDAPTENERRVVSQRERPVRSSNVGLQALVGSYDLEPDAQQTSS